LKTHDEKRYTCAHHSCSSRHYFSTWTELQAHNRTAHPATCPYDSCMGKTFTQQKGLKAHLKLHEQRDLEHVLNIHLDGEHDADAEDSSAEDARSVKRRRGGEIGRDWKCDIDCCTKDFKSKKALTNHINVTHHQERKFVCTEEGCGMQFGYKHLLQRHTSKAHPAAPQPQVYDEEETLHYSQDNNALDTRPEIDIDYLTGKEYADRAKDRLATESGVQCPCPDFPTDFLEPDSSSECQHASTPCKYVFSRAYDLRRHLRAEHGLEVCKEVVDKWARGARDAGARQV